MSVRDFACLSARGWTVASLNFQTNPTKLKEERVCCPENCIFRTLNELAVSGEGQFVGAVKVNNMPCAPSDAEDIDVDDDVHKKRITPHQ